MTNLPKNIPNISTKPSKLSKIGDLHYTKRSKGKYRSAKQGLFKLTHPEKFIKVLDEHMGSSKNEGYVEYKSSLEYKAIKYADFNPLVKCWSMEPFAIPYIKPTDNKIHRYYIDLFLEFQNGEKFLIEVKSYSETIPPIKPKYMHPKAVHRYVNEMMTFRINQAKWDSAKKFAEKKGLHFAILTEKQLNF